MKKLCLFIFLLLLSVSTFADDYFFDFDETSVNKNWTQISKTPEVSMRFLIEVLKKSTTGKQLLKEAQIKAADSGETLFDILKAGEGSITDTTLIRKFNQNTPDQIFYESKSKVFINRDLNVMDAVLDMAHELTHYTFRHPFNPYTDDFSVEQFIASTIEGTGGEVDAFLMECKVLSELFPSKMGIRNNCHRVRDDKTGYFSKTHGIKEFYKLGSYYSEFNDQIKKFNLSEDKNATPHAASFISSAYGVPYPLAAVREFKSVMGRVCENDKKRLAYMQAGISRGPASEKNYESIIKSHETRCSSIK